MQRLYVDKLKRVIPEDNNVTEFNVMNVFFDINKKTSIKEILRSNMMIISTMTLLKMLYCDNLITIEDDVVEWKNNEKYESIPKLLNVLDMNMLYKNEKVTKDIFENRQGKPNLQYYQSFNTYQSNIRRFNLMRKYGDVYNKRIVFLGDDELFCVFYALNAYSYEKILVLDIDDKLLKEIDW